MAPVGEWIQEREESPVIVMVGNPPAFNYHTGLSAVVIPNENLDRTLEAARRYGASYLILDQNHPRPLASLYRGDQHHPRLDSVWDAASGAPAGIVVFQLTAR